MRTCWVRWGALVEMREALHDHARILREMVALLDDAKGYIGDYFWAKHYENDPDLAYARALLATPKENA